jgi:DDE superfamily endonuclease
MKTKRSTLVHIFSSPMSLLLDSDDEDEGNVLSIPTPKKTRQRMDWEAHEAALIHENKFHRMYRMNVRSFHGLVRMLAPFLQQSEEMSILSTGQAFIRNEIVLHCTLRYLAGGSVHDIRTVAGISYSYCYDLIRLGIDAILQCGALKMDLPDLRPKANQSDEESSAIQRRLLYLQETFTKNATSTPKLFVGCVGAVDGWLACVRVPTKKEEKHTTMFYSGHYKTYGINVQAMCDGNSRFLAASMRSPGSANDIVAYQRATFVDTFVNHLPRALFIVGDNAYPLSGHVMVPFRITEMQTDTKAKDVYNFYQSQMRIRIEMAFGMLVAKWRIFKSPLQHSPASATKIIEAAMRLHNYCIDERLKGNDDGFRPRAPQYSRDRNSEQASDIIEYLPSDHAAFHATSEEDGTRRKRAKKDDTKRRSIINIIKANGTTRPVHNLERRARLQEEETIE